MGFFNKKNGKKGRPSSTYSQEPLTTRPGSGAPLNTQYSKCGQIYVLAEKDKKYKRTIRILRFISRLLSLVLSVLMVGILAYALSRYFLTRNNILPSSSSSSETKTVWPVPIMLWPTYMLLGISLTTAITNAVTLAMYCFSTSVANKTSEIGSWLGYALMGLYVLVWVVSSGAFKLVEMRSEGKDLWGYTCSGAADAIEAEVKSFVDFGRLCSSQGAAWYASILQTALYLLAFTTTVFIARRARTKTKMGRMRDSVAFEMQNQHDSPAQYINPYMAGGYGGGPQESGMLYSEGGAGNGKRYMPVAREVGPLS